MANKQLTYEEEDQWLRDIQLGKRDSFPDGRTVEEVREAVHNPGGAVKKESEAERQTIEGLLKLSKEDLLEMAKNAHIADITGTNTKLEIAEAIIKHAEQISEVE